MGCDIHAFVEYRIRPEGEPDRRHSWSAFGGEINPGRNYWLFEIMAGVRGRNALFEPRGIPNDMAYSAWGEYWLYLTEDDRDEEGCASREQAARWVASGSSVYYPELEGLPKRVSDPDAHSMSWLTLPEMRRVMTEYRIRCEKGNAAAIAPTNGQAIATLIPLRQDPKWHALIAVMTSLEESGYESRLVFWFDN